MRKTRIAISVLLAVCMVLSVCTVAVIADGNNAFSDVADGAWYREAVEYVYSLGLMNGVGDGSFASDAPMTRAMFVTVLHRLAGSPKAASAPSFKDVEEGAWYYDAVAWAAETGITKGYGNGFFGPDDPVTREQTAAFSFRFGNEMGYDMDARADISGFADAEELTEEMAEAMSWAVAAGLFVGDGANSLNPKSSANRAEVAAVTMRLDNWTKSDEAQPEPEPEPVPEEVPKYIPLVPEVPHTPTPQELQYPVVLSEDGATVTYGFEGEEETITLGEKNIFLDGRLTDEEAAELPYVYTTFNEAVTHLVDGTAEEPMNLWIAPWVYWIHDPASEETTLDYQLTFGKKNLHITGLTDYPENVVVAANYGHDEGYYGGNPTMFKVSGDGLELRNMTFGNYCNIDLVYPLNPELNVPKRTTNITQAQIASYSGDRLYAENVNFISRLNMMPFNNSKRALYVNCHLESTADSLNSSSQAVYLNCDFEFHSGKAWGGSSGVTILNSDMKIIHQFTDRYVTELTHYMVKMSGRFNVIDSRFTSDYPKATVKIGWCDVINNTYRSYISNVTHNGKPEFITDGGAKPDASVDLTGLDALKAYKVVVDGEVVYNVYNLLRGTDGWDPLGQKEIIEAAGAQDVATGMSVRNSGKSTLESGSQDRANLSYTLSGPQRTNYTDNAEVTWSVKPEFEDYVVLTPSADGKTCTVEGTNNEEEAVTVVVTAKDKSGLEAAASIVVRPSILEAPAFTEQPVITQNANGTATVSYGLELGERADMSRIVWSLCDDADGTNPVEIAVGRGNEPLKTIPLFKSYEGKVLRAVISPKHIRSDYGQSVTVYSEPLTADKLPGVPTALSFNVGVFSTATQKKALPGIWSVDTYKPADTATGQAFGANWVEPNGETGFGYGTGVKDGVINYSGIYVTQRGGRLRFTPEGAAYGDMSFTVKVAPGKTAAQGFGSANQYMDVMVKYDTANHVGYGLRIFRFTGNSCKFVLVKHNADGTIDLLGEPVESRVFLTECTIAVRTENGKLKAHVESTGSEDTVDLEATVEDNNFGGICIQHTGTVGDNTVYIGSMNAGWTIKDNLPS